MKTKTLLTMLFLAVATAASAQVEFFYTTFGRNVICRDKKLFWMDGDDDPCFNIVNYKKVGNKETFTLTPCEKGDSKYSVTITLKDNKASHIVMKSDITYSSDIELKTEKDGDRDLLQKARWLYHSLRCQRHPLCCQRLTRQIQRDTRCHQRRSRRLGSEANPRKSEGSVQEKGQD